LNKYCYLCHKYFSIVLLWYVTHVLKLSLSSCFYRDSMSWYFKCNLHISLNPCTAYKRARYLTARIEIYLLCLRAFSRKQRANPNWRQKKGRNQATGRDLRLPWKFNLWKLGYMRSAGERVEGLKAARIGLTFCPEPHCKRGGYTTVGFKLKRPWSHRSLCISHLVQRCG